jgi:hypothetical protein
MPALGPNGMLIGIATPYRRVGLLYAKHRDCFGQNNDDILVVQGPTLTFNPTYDEADIARKRAADPQGAIAEWDAEFRSDLAAFLDDASIDAAIDRGRPPELPVQEATVYFAFVDMSGGRHDASCICIVLCQPGKLSYSRCGIAAPATDNVNNNTVTFAMHRLSSNYWRQLFR